MKPLTASEWGLKGQAFILEMLFETPLAMSLKDPAAQLGFKFLFWRIPSLNYTSTQLGTLLKPYL